MDKSYLKLIITFVICATIVVGIWFLKFGIGVDIEVDIEDNKNPNENITNNTTTVFTLNQIVTTFNNKEIIKTMNKSEGYKVVATTGENSIIVEYDISGSKTTNEFKLKDGILSAEMKTASDSMLETTAVYIFESIAELSGYDVTKVKSLMENASTRTLEKDGWQITETDGLYKYEISLKSKPVLGVTSGINNRVYEED